VSDFWPRLLLRQGRAEEISFTKKRLAGMTLKRKEERKVQPQSPAKKEIRNLRHSALPTN